MRKFPILHTLLMVEALALASCLRRPDRLDSKPQQDNPGTGDDSPADEPIETGEEPKVGQEPTTPSNGSWPDAEPLKAWTDPGAAAPVKDPALATQVHKYFNIHVVDSVTKENIPGAVLSTVHNIRLTSDKNGFVAFYEPGLMNTRVYFNVTHPGYAAKKDGLGIAGAIIDMKEGGSAFIYLDKTTGQAVPIAHDKDTRRLLGMNVPLPTDIFGIRIVDKVTHRGVPIVRLLAADGQEYYSDNFGYVAIEDTDLIGSEVSFKMTSDGYEAQDIKVKIEKGAEKTFEIVRRNIAERLYRSTGAGSYRDSTLLGYKAPVAQPHIDGLVVGQDTLNAIVYKGKLFWIWQDTSRPAYPLGNFGNSGAVADLPGKGNISQDIGINRQYYVDGDGFSRPMAPDFEPAGSPTWMGSLVSVPDASGNEKMFGIYGKAVAAADVGKRGWGLFDDESGTFKDLPNFAKAEYVPGEVLMPNADPVKVRHGADDYLYYGYMRVRAKADAILNIDAYETYGPYESKSKTPVKNADGSLAYAWRKNAYPPVAEDMKKAGVAVNDILSEVEFKDAEGKAVALASGSLEKNWNNFRKRYLGTIQQKFGTSFLGEAWIAEADTPLGPWNFATKILSHDKYTFYNLQQHPFYDREGGRLIYIHGTYTNFFTNEIPTPRHDYNQVLYRLDLADQRVIMPVAVYDLSGDSGANFAVKGDLHPDTKPLAAAFFAMEAQKPGTQGLAWSAPECNPKRRLIPSTGEPSAFFVLPAATAANDANEKLYEFKDAKGHYAYSTKAELSGFTRENDAIGLVWKSSTQVKIPVGDYLGDLVAHAGADQCLKSAGAETKVSLDGSQSRHLNGTIKSYEWSVRSKDVAKKASGAKATVDLPPGLYFVELKVVDGDGVESKDHAMLEIE